MSGADFLFYTIAVILIVYMLVNLVWFIVNEYRYRKWLKGFRGNEYYENLRELQEKLNAKEKENE